MNILILHCMGPRSRWLASVADIALALPRYAPQHNYLIHDASLPLPEFVKDVPFDAIVINSSFVGLLDTPATYTQVLHGYEFIRDNGAFSIALPQDDYWCSDVRDAWFTEFGINSLHPVCAEEHWHRFYPRYVKSGRPMSLMYTGYITPKLRQRAANPKAHALREYDVVYRAKGKPAFPNRLGYLKAEIGERFEQAFAAQSLKLDISTNTDRTIRGDKWLDFVENSRAILGSNSGSSLIVRNYEYSTRVGEYTRANPTAGYEEILEACFPGEDGQYEFTAISPRNLEAGMLNTLQITVPGAYSDILEPWQHYVPLEEDCSNVAEVMGVLNAPDEAQRIARQCRDALTACQAIQIEHFVESILDSVTAGLPSTHQSMPADKFRKLVQRHKDETAAAEKALARSESVKFFLKKSLPAPVLKFIRRIRGV